MPKKTRTRRQLRAILHGKRRAAMKRTAMFEGMADGAHRRLADTEDLARQVRDTPRDAFTLLSKTPPCRGRP